MSFLPAGAWAQLPAACDAAFGLGTSCALAAAAGALYARRRGEVPTRVLLHAALVLALACGAWAAAGARWGGAPSVRTLAFVPPLAWASATFGATLAVLAGARPFFADAPLALRIGRRLLLSDAAQVVSTVSRIAVLGVSLGVWLVLVAMGILGGFEHDLVDKLRGSGSDLTVTQVGFVPLSLADGAQLARCAAALPGARALSPYVEAELAVASGSNYGGAIALGVDPAQAQAVPLVAALPPEQRSALAEPCRPHCPVVLGAELAHNLGVALGGRVRLISPVTEVLTPVGPAPTSLSATVVGLSHSKMYEADSRTLLAAPQVVQRLMGWPSGAYSGVALSAHAPEAIEALVQRAPVALGGCLGVAPDKLLPISWKARNQTLFAALELERVVAAVVLAFIILVASFSIVNTLSMSIRERRHEIAMLRAMGASTPLILQVFLGQGMLIGGIGTAVGALAGVASLLALRHFGFGIPYEVYYIDALPVDIAWADVVGVVAAALLILWDFAVVPSSQAARLRPAEGLRDG